MRTPVIVNVVPYDVDSAQPRVDAVRNAFDRYLDQYIPKSSRSKHGLMGPVGKILSEAKSGRSDPDYLKGYVLRVHELSQARPPSPEAVKALEEGIDLFVDLLQQAPITARDRLIDRIDYGLYFTRRKKFIRWLDERNRDYRAWLQESHADLNALNQTWGTRFKSWDELRYSGPASRAYRTAAAKQREDMDRFAKRMKEVGKAVVVEIDLEEEEP
jgi:hypothetical protein